MVTVFKFKKGMAFSFQFRKSLYVTNAFYLFLFIYTIFREGYTFSYKPVYQVALYKQLIKHNTTIYKLYIKYKITDKSWDALKHVTAAMS